MELIKKITIEQKGLKTGVLIFNNESDYIDFEQSENIDNYIKHFITNYNIDDVNTKKYNKTTKYYAVSFDAILLVFFENLDDNNNIDDDFTNYIKKHNEK